jgi:transcriptional regulator with XRE-family HTH domain
MSAGQILAEFGRLFKQARRQKGFSRPKLAAKVGINYKTIQTWEQGKVLIGNIELFITFHKLLGKSIVGMLAKAITTVEKSRMAKMPLKPETPAIAPKPKKTRRRRHD